MEYLSKRSFMHLDISLRKKSGDTLNDKSGKYLMPAFFAWEDND